jgi:hypothetical protein
MQIRHLGLLIFALLLAPLVRAQTTIFSCSSFATSGSTCGVGAGSQGSSGLPFGYVGGTGVSGGAIVLVAAGAGHNSYGAQYQHLVNTQAFTTTFTFVPNGYNLAFVVQNCTSDPSTCHGAGTVFVAGASSEAGFSQGGGAPNIAPNNVFALELDSYEPLNSTDSFTYSSSQIYQTLQAPYTTGSYGSTALPSYVTNKISTSPVPLNSPANSAGTTTGDTYSATITYDGYTVTLALFDVTAGGSCPGASCFTQSWSGVYIPAITASTTGNVGFTNGVGESPATNLLIKSWSYTVETPTGTPSYTAWNANSTYTSGSGAATSAASPVYSVSPGTYSSTRSVSLTTSTTPNNYICYVLSATPLTPASSTLYPHPDSNGGCNAGTLYSGAISVSSTATLYATAGSNNSAFALGSVGASGLGPPSTLVAGTYTISGSAAATPTFSPVAGAYTGAQSVTLSTSSSGAIICYNTTGSPATNGTTGCNTGTIYSAPVTVSSSEILYAVAGGTGYSDGSVGSAAYTINPSLTPPTQFSGKVKVANKAVIH